MSAIKPWPCLRCREELGAIEAGRLYLLAEYGKIVGSKSPRSVRSTSGRTPGSEPDATSVYHACSSTDAAMSDKLWLCRRPDCGAVLGRVRDRVLVLAQPLLIENASNEGIYVPCQECGYARLWAAAPDPFAKRGRSLGDNVPLHPRPFVQLSTEELIDTIEERWLTFSQHRLREKGTLAVGLRFDVFVRDEFRCRYCGRSVDDRIVLHVDHVIPRSQGGPTTLENLVTACSDCNLGKSDKALTA